MPRSVASTSASLGSFLVGQIIAIMGVASVDLNSGACQGRAWYNCQESQQKPYKVLDCYIVTSYPKTTTDNNTLLLKLRQGSQTDLVWWPILLRVVLSTQATGMGSSPSFVVRPQHSLHHRIAVSKDSTQDFQKSNINDVLNRIERSE